MARRHLSCLERYPKKMPPFPQFNAIKWFSQFSESGAEIDAAELQPVLEFTLIWNLFERETCDRFARIDSVRQHVNRASNRGLLQRESYEQYLTFFRQRYPHHDEGEFLADRLLSGQRRYMTRDIEDINLLRDILAGTSTDTNNVVYSLLFVAFRVRNNLFHGEKDVYTLHLQKDLFQTINSLLSTYLQQTCRQLAKNRVPATD